MWYSLEERGQIKMDSFKYFLVVMLFYLIIHPSMFNIVFGILFSFNNRFRSQINRINDSIDIVDSILLVLIHLSLIFLITFMAITESDNVALIYIILGLMLIIELVLLIYLPISKLNNITTSFRQFNLSFSSIKLEIVYNPLKYGWPLLIFIVLMIVSISYI